MIPAPSFLDALKTAAERASTAEDTFRREIAQRTKALEVERAQALRRLNLMRTLAEGIATAESEEVAVAAATAILRTKLGWAEDSDARGEVLSKFAAVAQAMFASLAPVKDEAPEPDVIKTLDAFETWYAQTHPQSFWALFDVYMPETPRVDF
ncbi:MAG: hypothetical protein JO205_00685 [Pseudolabrys sp.]|nr:hypothetical protein [Pseudolabrys sp.]